MTNLYIISAIFPNEWHVTRYVYARIFKVTFTSFLPGNSYWILVNSMSIQQPFLISKWLKQFGWRNFSASQISVRDLGSTEDCQQGQDSRCGWSFLQSIFEVDICVWPFVGTIPKCFIRNTLPGATTSARYSAYADNVTVFIMNNAEIDKVNKESRKYEMVAVAKFNCSKAVGLQLSSWKEFSFPRYFTWMVHVKHYESGLVLTSNWRKIDQKFWRNLRHSSSVVFEESFLKDPGGNMFFISTSFYLTVTVLSFLCTKLVYPVWIMWGIKTSHVCCEICYIHPSEGSLGLLDFEIHQHTHCISFLDWLCSQKDSNSEFRIEDNKNVFLALRSLHLDDEEAFVYSKMSASSIASAIVLWRPYYELRLTSLTYIYCWGRHHVFMLGHLRKQWYCSLCLCMQGLKSLNNKAVSLTWYVMWNVQKALFSKTDNFNRMCMLVTGEDTHWTHSLLLQPYI